MEIIDRKHPEIAKNASGKANSFVSFPNDKEIYFSHAAAIEYKLVPHKYLHFAVLSGFLYFFVDDNSDGFMLLPDGKTNTKAVKVITKSGIAFLKEKFPKQIKPKSRFALHKTTGDKNGHKLIEILIYKNKK